MRRLTHQRNKGTSGGPVALPNRWSQAATWGGALPTSADDVVIPNGQTYTLDTAGVFNTLTIHGTLRVDPAVLATGLAGKWIEVSATGALEIGTEAEPYTGLCVITLNGVRADAGIVNRYVADQTGTSGAGNGRLARLFGTSTAADGEVITVTFTSATAFNVSSSVAGSLGSGTVGTLFNNRVRFIATAGSTAWANGHTRTITVARRGSSQGTSKHRRLLVMGGRLDLHTPAKTPRTVLNAHTANGATAITLADAVSGWKSGDQVVVGPTDFRDVAGSGATHLTTLAANPSGTSATLAAGISGARWGVLQYITDAGFATAPGTLTKHAQTLQAAHDAIPKILDERAPVINLTRGIRIESPSDSDWTSNGFGVDVMVMGHTAVIRVDGIEVRRGGKRGVLGAYPFHWHMSSYNLPDGSTLPSDGTYLGSCAGQYIRRSAINVSENRAIVIHGSHGVEVTDCVAHDIRTHAFFFEEGSEEACVMSRNVAMKVRNVASDTDALVGSDSSARGCAGFWLSNPSNTFDDNWAFDCEHWGILNGWAMPSCIGQSQEVAIVPRARPITSHSGNTAACNGTSYMSFKTDAGMATQFPHTDNRGTAGDVNFDSATVQANLPIVGAKLWKNMNKGYGNRVWDVEYRGWTLADNERIDFVGAAAQINGVSFGHQCLLASNSLNNATDRAASTNKAGVASYHELLFFKDCIFVNYVYRAPTFIGGDSLVPTSGGAVQVNDLYTDAEFTFAEFTGLKLINSVFATRVRPPHLGDGAALGSRHWSLSGAIRDTAGTHVGTGRTWIYDVPFMTTDAVDLQNVAPAGNNEKHTSSLFYGVTPFTSAEVNNFTSRRPIDVRRLDAAYADIPAAAGSTWTVGDGASSPYVPFRHFPVMKGGRYRVLWASDTVNWSVLRVDHGEQSSDNFLVAVQHNAASVSSAFITTNPSNAATAGTPPLTPSAGEISANEARLLTSVGSIATCAATPNSYYHQSSLNRVWVNYQGGLVRPGWGGGDIGQRQKSHYICIK